MVNRAQGPRFNVSGTVAVPVDKIAKHNYAFKNSSTPTNPRFQQSTIFRESPLRFNMLSAGPQTLQVFATIFPRLHIRRRLPKDVRQDLRWHLAVLAQGKKFHSIPVEHFAHLLLPSRHVFMDASDTGVCVLEPQFKQYIRVQFSEAVQQTFTDTKTHTSTNVHELMGPVLAAFHWGPTRRDTTHVQMWIGNTSAVAWLEKRASQHPIARAYNRLISLAESQHSFSCSAIQILPPFDDPLSLWETCSGDMLSQVQLPGNTQHTGTSGAHAHAN
ncbi:hypothetical protein PHMEG_00017254 [Phytophthora megakarya]|uniref:Cleavage induced protein n=1 Tax=Phytophthora megakarya TaxID=4795 RepID=A0A225VX96_9STRA|nr:hypothetical protein PHMEG_00017254 [Phytophthora megakarya]